MAPRIAIPMPHSSDLKYGARAIPQYERAVELAGGEAVRVPLDRTPQEVAKIIDGCDGVLLPGSNADVDPTKFHAERSPHTAAADLRRDHVDELLLQKAFESRKPVLGICYGLQILNVYCRGSLVQHIPEFLPESTRERVDHGAGRKVAIAHTVEIEAGSRLAEIVNSQAPSTERTGGRRRPQISAWEALRHPRTIRSLIRGRDNTTSQKSDGTLILPVNSSHHQSANAVGEGLSVVARCPDDGIIEGLEGTDADHFVLAVQWHPERSVQDDQASYAIFHALVDAAESYNQSKLQGKQESPRR